jgi:hypothetical protein
MCRIGSKGQTAITSSVAKIRITDVALSRGGFKQNVIDAAQSKNAGRIVRLRR